MIPVVIYSAVVQLVVLLLVLALLKVPYQTGKYFQNMIPVVMQSDGTVEGMISR